jgi:PAS domain-containing protein
VVSTDTDGCVSFLNPIAEAYTEWTMQEAAGLHLHDVLRILNDKTAEPLTNIWRPFSGMAG